MKIYKIINIIIFMLSILCFILKAVLPETVAADGTLRENFFLLPIGFGPM